MRSPYEAIFGTRQINSLENAYLPTNVLNQLQNEDDLEVLIHSMENEHDDDQLTKGKKRRKRK